MLAARLKDPAKANIIFLEGGGLSI
jgi:hypothetical protein